MPIGRGWWIAPDGEISEILEHLGAIDKDPGRFGFSREELLPLKEEIGKKGKGKRRKRILRQAIKKGFIRVRFDNHRHVAEFYGWERCKRLIMKFLRQEHFVGSGIELMLNDLESGTERRMKVDHILAGEGSES
jgi:hypothetical protein